MTARSASCGGRRGCVLRTSKPGYRGVRPWSIVSIVPPVSISPVVVVILVPDPELVHVWPVGSTVGAAVGSSLGDRSRLRAARLRRRWSRLAGVPVWAPRSLAGSPPRLGSALQRALPSVPRPAVALVPRQVKSWLFDCGWRRFHNWRRGGLFDRCWSRLLPRGLGGLCDHG